MGNFTAQTREVRQHSAIQSMSIAAQPFLQHWDRPSMLNIFNFGDYLTTFAQYKHQNQIKKHDNFYDRVRQSRM